MTRAAAERLTWFIAGVGAVTIAAVAALRGPVPALSTAAGVAIALANWFALRMLVDRLLGGSIRRQAGLALVLIAKVGAFMGAVFILLQGGYVQPIPFTFGVSSLMVGPILGSLVLVLLTPKTESEPADAAR
jgi:hypothetical protein